MRLSRVFNGEVGQAAAGVELVGRGDGLGRAGGEAAGATAAMIRLGPVGREFQRGEDFGKEEPVPQAAADEVGVLAGEAEAGAPGEIALQNGPGVHVPK